MRRWKTAAAVLLAAAAAVLLALNQAALFSSPDWLSEWLGAQWFRRLLEANVLLSAVMAALGIYILVGYWRRSKRRGYRLAARLSGYFVIMATFPALVIYGAAAGGLLRSLESWFDEPFGEHFEQGMQLGEEVVAEATRELESVAFALRRQLTRRNFGEEDLEELAAASNLRVLQIYDEEGVSLFSVSPESEAQDADSAPEESPADSNSAAPPLPLSDAVLLPVRRGQTYTWLDSADDSPNGGRYVMEIGVPLPDGRILLVKRDAPAAATAAVGSLREGRNKYNSLQVYRDGLRKIFLITLTLTLIMMSLASVWVAGALSRRLSRPLRRLTMAVGAVAAGDYAPRRLPAGGRDEFAVLAERFNEMMDNLAAAREKEAQAREAIGKMHADLDSLFSGMSVGVMTFAADGSLQTFNPATERLLAADMSPLLKMRPQQWVSTNPALSAFAEVATKVLAAGAPTEERGESARANILLVRGLPLPGDPAGRQLVIVDDITAQMEMERQTAWEDVMRRFSHEIKNPLTPIQLAAERLEAKLGEKLDGEDRALLVKLSRTIVNQATAMRDMISDYRSDRPGRRGAVAVMQRTDLCALAREAGALYGMAEGDFQFSSPQAIVAGNPAALRAALNNLLINAQQASSGARPQISLKRGAAGGWRLAVEDSGGGIPEAMLPEIFKGSVSSKGRGRGLGLAIVKRIVEEHGGEVFAENTGAGARFVLSFPDAGDAPPA